MLKDEKTCDKIAHKLPSPMRRFFENHHTFKLLRHGALLIQPLTDKFVENLIC